MPLIFVIIALLVMGCSQDSDYQFKSEIGNKVVLERFPDSLDMANAKELRHYKQDKSHIKKPVDIGLDLPGVPSAFRKPAKKTQIVHRKFLSKEEFVERFSKTLTKLKNDPQNRALAFVVTTKNATTIQRILSKKYSAYAASIPDVLIKYEVQALNPEINLNAIAANQRIIFPRVDLFK